MPTLNNLPRLSEDQRKLVEDNMNLAYKCASEIAPHTTLEYEDVVQYCLLGLCKAALIFDESKGALSSVAYQCMRNEIYMKTRRTKKRIAQNELLSLDAPCPNTEDFTLLDTIEDSYDRISEAESYMDLMSAISKVPISRRHIAQYLIDNPQSPQGVVAKKFNCTQSNISRVKKELIKHWLNT
jgi:RNA polymerase sigma factor (sigma-70 family)